MFYEGAEKRLEITTDLPLKTFPDSFWHEIVEEAGASILSTIKNDHVKAYLLSESSLFIWDHKLLLITCGETHLLNAALYFLERIDNNKISSLLFQRHQTFIPAKQKSHFIDDCDVLNTYLNGKIQQRAQNYSGDLYQYKRHNLAGKTQHILMLHQLSGSLTETLWNGFVSVDFINQKLQLSTFFEDFIIDAFSFEPKGYSVNGIANNDYFTLHITPEKNSTYLSFETSLSEKKCKAFHQFLIKLFHPKKNCLLNL